MSVSDMSLLYPTGTTSFIPVSHHSITVGCFEGMMRLAITLIILDCPDYTGINVLQNVENKLAINRESYPRRLYSSSLDIE